MDYELLSNGKITLGGVAPDFMCDSTIGKIKNPSSDQWTILFSYKEDFDLVSTSEIIEFEKNFFWFQKLNTRILAISMGTILSHYAWLEKIDSLYKISITIPVLEDPIGEIARKYGMVSKELGNNVITNNVVIIDKNSKVQANIEYMPFVHRNISEILRIVELLQDTSDRFTAFSK